MGSTVGACRLRPAEVLIVFGFVRRHVARLVPAVVVVITAMEPLGRRWL